MSLQKTLSQSIFCSLLFLSEMASFASVASAQDLSKTVFPITQLKLLGPGADVKFATGFCLSADCRFVGTNYHVAMMTQLRKIKGDKVIHCYLATGPDDDGATVNSGFLANPLKYNPGRDIAIYELHYPLHNYYGIPFSLKDLQLGQQVDIYAYPKESANPTRSLQKFHGAFKGETTGGLLAFDYSPSNGKVIRSGASGGLVVDSKSQQVVGILSGVAEDEELVAVAVPIDSLANFVSKVEPWLAQSLFPTANKETVSPASADLYPRFVPPPPGSLLEHRPEERPEVAALRRKAQDLTDSIRNFIAVQTFEWGSGNKGSAAKAEYEVRVVDDVQRFRKLPDGNKELEEVLDPSLNGFLVPSDEWSKLPKLVGMDPRLKVNYAGDAVVSDRRLKVFQYQATVEDHLCPFAPQEDFLFFAIAKTVSVPCYGEVWTDADTNILRISKNLDLSRKLKAYRGWEEIRVVITYGWLKRSDESARLVPVTISSEGRYGRHIFWCRGSFTDYRIFDSRAKIVNASTDRAPGLPP